MEKSVCQAHSDVHQVKNDLKRFFQLLDTVEESDNGRLFHPITFSCCRTMMLIEANEILDRLKKFSEEKA